MKKRLVWLLAAILTVCCTTTALTSCSENDNPAPSDSSERQYAAEVYQYLNRANEREWISEAEAAAYRPSRLWRYEVKNKKDRLPKQFRTCHGQFDRTPINDHPLPEPDYRPSRTGFDKLCISGSSRFSLKELEMLTDTINRVADGRTKVMIDLRGECHGLVNGAHMSWYGQNNWSNIGRHREDIVAEEAAIFDSLPGKTITTAEISSDNAYQPMDIADMEVTAELTMTERQAVEQQGWTYYRVTALDHAFPSDEVIDQFLDIYRALPANAWLHFHCHKGNGRTTTFMSFYDMLRNPDVPLKDILYRQALIGGGNLYYNGDDESAELAWRVPLYQETNMLIPLLYDYVQDNRNNGYQSSWSEWKKTIMLQHN